MNITNGFLEFLQISFKLTRTEGNSSADCDARRMVMVTQRKKGKERGRECVVVWEREREEKARGRYGAGGRGG